MHAVPSTPVSTLLRHAVPMRSLKSMSHACVVEHPHCGWMSHGWVVHVLPSIAGVSIGASDSAGGESCGPVDELALAHAETEARPRTSGSQATVVTPRTSHGSHS